MFKLTAFCSLEFVLGTYAFVDDRIVGGQEATRNQFPHQVSIRRLRGTTHFCGGAIVSDRFVLTVAHCTQGILSIPSEIVIAAGAFRHFDDGTLHRVIRIVNHPRFNPRKLENDISTIQTRTQIVFGPNVSAISLPVSNLPDENGLPLTVSGWGQNRLGYPTDNPDAFPDNLQFMNAASLSLSDCRDRMPPHMRQRINEKVICVNNRAGQSFCAKDEGGGVINNNLLVGLVSWRVWPCGSIRPDVNTRIFSHLEFIRNTTGLPRDSNFTLR